MVKLVFCSGAGNRRVMKQGDDNVPARKHPQSSGAGQYSAPKLMIDVFSHPDYTRVALARNLLEAAGIASFIRNEESHNLITGIPIALFEPKLCVMRDEDVAQARTIIDEGVAGWVDESGEGLDGGEEWTCGKCGETVPVEYGSCWNCDTVRDEPAADGDAD